MDALLPHPGRSWRSTAPAPLLTHLDSLTEEGRVPPWHAWWPKGSVASLFGNQDDYSRFAKSLKHLPAAYFEEIAPAIALPASLRCSYLRLSEACETDAREAELRGWPVQRLSLNHLAMLTHAKQVCVALEGLLPAAPHAI